MSRTIANRDEARRWQAEHDPQAPKVGAPAPDFSLADSSGTRTVRLADFKGQRPVALVFGSFT